MHTHLCTSAALTCACVLLAPGTGVSPAGSAEASPSPNALSLSAPTSLLHTPQMYEPEPRMGQDFPPACKPHLLGLAGKEEKSQSLPWSRAGSLQYASPPTAWHRCADWGPWGTPSHCGVRQGPKAAGGAGQLGAHRAPEALGEAPGRGCRPGASTGQSVHRWLCSRGVQGWRGARPAQLGPGVTSGNRNTLLCPPAQPPARPEAMHPACGPFLHILRARGYSLSSGPLLPRVWHTPLPLAGVAVSLGGRAKRNGQG